MPVDVVIPTIGESIKTVFISRWIKKAGEAVAAGEPIVEVDSDKASLEVPSPAAGVLSETLAAAGDEVEIGAVIGRIAEGSAPAASAPAKAQEAPAKAADDVRAGPAARQEAGKLGVALADVAGTGPHGRVTTADVAAAAKPASAPAKPEAPRVEAPKAPKAAPSGDRVQRVAMTPMRRTIARRLIEAQSTAAILTTFNEVDVSRVMALRAEHQDRFVKKYGVKLGFMSFFAKASIEALKAFPAVNAEIDGNEIVYKNYYNLSIAVSGPKGLVVPVLKDADRLSFAETEIEIAALATKAKDNKLRPEDFEDGTFSITNGGIFGSMMSTPILNPPQVGILGMHNIVDRPVVRDGQIVIRPMMYLALSYDHRIIDGREAVSFLVRVKECIEAPERMLLEI